MLKLRVASTCFLTVAVSLACGRIDNEKIVRSTGGGGGAELLLRPQDAVCSSRGQCASGRCSAENAETCGICLSVRRLGASCRSANETCSYTATCTAGVCVSTKGVIGDSCRRYPKGDDDCDADLFCNVPPDNTEYIPIGQCEARRLNGATCTRSNECETDACTKGNCAEPLIEVRANLGESCEARSCAGNLNCVDAVCQKRPVMKIGERCKWDDVCAEGAHCGITADREGLDYVFKCTALIELGAKCKSTTECRTGLWCDLERVVTQVDGHRQFDEIGVCKAPSPTGSKCTWADECDTGLECRAGSCRTACR